MTRLHGTDVLAQLARIGANLARSTPPVCLCHLLNAQERSALASSGACVVPVVHNAERGWLEPALALASAPT